MNGREGGRKLEREVSSGEFDAPLLYLEKAERDKILHKMGMIRVVESSQRYSGNTLQRTTEHSEVADVGHRGA